MESSSNSITTLARRKSLAQITSGAISELPKITQIALGDGGVDGEGKVILPLESQTALHHELSRYGVAPVEYPAETTARYTVTIAKGDLVGKAISEVGLVDEAGTFCALRNTLPKYKESDEEFTFVFDDEF